MPRFMVRQSIQRKIVLEAVDADMAAVVARERYSEPIYPDVTDPISRVLVLQFFNLPIAVKPDAYPAELEKL